MSDQPVKIHIDGASRGNPGPAAYAFVIAGADGTHVEDRGTLGQTTNNIAEYTALLKALEKAAALSLQRLHIHSDSELLVKQMNGEYRVKNPDIKELYDQAQELLGRFRSVTLSHVRREQNKRADELCNLALDGNKPPAAKRPKHEKAKGKASDVSVRDDVIACIEAAAAAWLANDPHAPTAEQVWDQIWSVLEEGNVLKKR